jgi:hypothetical protein
MRCVVPESWPGVRQKSSWSFVIGVIYLQFLRIFSFAISYQLLSFFFNFRIVGFGGHHSMFPTSPHALTAAAALRRRGGSGGGSATAVAAWRWRGGGGSLAVAFEVGGA